MDALTCTSITDCEICLTRLCAFYETIFGTFGCTATESADLGYAWRVISGISDCPNIPVIPVQQNGWNLLWWGLGLGLLVLALFFLAGCFWLYSDQGFGRLQPNIELRNFRNPAPSEILEDGGPALVNLDPPALNPPPPLMPILRRSQRIPTAAQTVRLTYTCLGGSNTL